MANQGAQKGCYLSAAELSQVEKAAAELDITVSAWIKRAIMDKLRREGRA